jgi:Transposase DNA-binding/Transposase Tn5 dimerisation domain
MDTRWIEEEFSSLDMGDKRLKDRFLAVASSLSLNPDECINKSIESFSDKKAAYRLFSNKKFSADEFFACHQNGTAERLRGNKVVLAIHDSTYFSFNNKRSIKGLGTIGGEDTHGFIGHYSLAVSGDGIPLGLLGLMPWSRFYESPWEKESQRWEESFSESQRFCPEGVQMVHLADREGDQFELHYSNLKSGRLFVVRSNHDRMIVGGDYYLSWHLDRQDVKSHAYIYDYKKNKNVSASLKYGEVTFTDPGVRYSSGHLNSQIRSVKLGVVEIKSDEKNEEGEYLRWVLLTNLPLDSHAQALKVVEYYRARWHIENYFKVLKDGGCKVERCSLRTYERVVKYASLFSIIAWRLYWIKHLSEVRGDEDIETAFTPEEGIVLHLKGEVPIQEKLSIEKAVRIIAKMGGFNGRRGDGNPGMVSLWRGFVKLQAQVELFMHLKEIKYSF